MRRLEMSWNTEGDRLDCRWTESKEGEKPEPFPVADWLRLSYNLGNQSTRRFTWPSRSFRVGRVA